MYDVKNISGKPLVYNLPDNETLRLFVGSEEEIANHKVTEKLERDSRDGFVRLRKQVSKAQVVDTEEEEENDENE